MGRRARIAEDFFDETFTQPESSKTATPPPKVEAAKPEPKPTPKETKAAPSESAPTETKVRTTLYIREELHEKARWAILNLEKAPRSISQLMEHALERELARLSKACGKEIERHRMALPGGRPRVTA
jgi:hypothetical protein